MCASYLGEVRRGHGKWHHGLHWLLLRVERKRRVVICTILSSSLVDTQLFALEPLVSKATSLTAIKVGLSIVVSPTKAITAVSIVIAGPITVCCPILCRITEDFLWSTVVTAATVLAIVIVPSTAGVTIPAIVSIPATSTAPWTTYSTIREKWNWTQLILIRCRK